MHRKLEVLLGFAFISQLLIGCANAQAAPFDFCAATKQLIQKGAIRKVDAPGGKLPHVWVGPVWHIMEYDHKASAVGIAAACYYGRVNPSDLTIVRDSQNGKRIGTYTPPDRLELK